MSKTSRHNKYERKHLVSRRTHDGSITYVDFVYRPPEGSGKHYNPTKRRGININRRVAV